MSNSFQLHGLQHAKFPCPSPTPGACSNSCPLSHWCQTRVVELLIQIPWTVSLLVKWFFFPFFLKPHLTDCGILVSQPGLNPGPLQFSSVQSLSHVRLFATPWIAARQASLSITNYQNVPKPMFIESVMPSNHLILCHPLLLLPSIFPTIRVFSNKWPKYRNFSFNISPSNTQDWSPLGWTGYISLQSKGLSWVFSNTTVQKHQFFGSTQSTQSPNHWSTREFLTRFFPKWWTTLGKITNKVKCNLFLIYNCILEGKKISIKLKI